jgi:hypothetical protein
MPDVIFLSLPTAKPMRGERKGIEEFIPLRKQ